MPQVFIQPRPDEVSREGGEMLPLKPSVVKSPAGLAGEQKVGLAGEQKVGLGVGGDQTKLKQLAQMTGEGQQGEGEAPTREHIAREDLDLAGEIDRRLQLIYSHNTTRGILHSMMESLRDRRGEYSPEKMAKIRTASAQPAHIFMRSSDTKTRTAQAWIKDILFTDGIRTWELRPSSLPELPESVMQEVVQLAMMKAQQQPQTLEDGTLLDPEQTQKLYAEQLMDEIMRDVEEEAAQRAKRMESLIYDQLENGNYKKAIYEFIDNFCTYRTAFLKGPYVVRRPVPKYNEETQTVEAVMKKQMTFSAPMPYDIMTSPQARDLQKGDLVERIWVSGSDMSDLLNAPGYIHEAVHRVLMDNPDGFMEKQYSIDEAERLQERETIERENGMGYYQGWHYWGFASAQDLYRHGFQIPEGTNPYAHLQFEAILFDHRVVFRKLHTSPLFTRPYFSASYQEVTGSVWGNGVCDLNRDISTITNAIARNMVLNISLAAGPQIMVDKSRMVQGENVTDIRPMRVWQLVGQRLSGETRPPVEFYQPSMNGQPLMEMMSFFNRLGDDYTGIPAYAHGNQSVGGAGRTASGLSMLMSGAARGIRTAVENVDKVIHDVIQLCHFYNLSGMLDNEEVENMEPYIGDVEVRMKGINALLAKEQLMARMLEFLNITNNNLDIQFVDRQKLLKEIIKLMNLDPEIVPDAMPPNAMGSPEEEAMMRLQGADMQEQTGELQPDGTPVSDQRMTPSGPSAI